MSDLERLDDYLRGAMTDGEVDAYEEDLFARAATGDAPELAFRERLATSVRLAVERGTFEVHVTAAEADRIAASGLKVQRLELANTPEMQTCAVERDCDLMISRFPIDLTGVRGLDVEIYAGDRLSKVMPDVSFDANDGAVFLCCEGELARKAAGFVARTKLYARYDDGRRMVAEINAVSVVVG
ncbi:MAG: hypothetical protein R3A52_15500 [Polyangiales bacterium]